MRTVNQKAFLCIVMTAIMTFAFCACGPDNTEYQVPNGKIGQATQDERGEVVGGEPGDQTGKELKASDYEYNEEKDFKHWKYLIRCTDPVNANKAADFVRDACDNENIGYNNYENTPEGVDLRNSLYRAAAEHDFDASAIDVPVDVSCTPLVLTGYSSAGIEMDDLIEAEYEGVSNQYTCRTVNAESLREAIEKVNSAYEARGEKAPFEIIELTGDQFEDYENNLKRGDVLCTGHHTGMML